MAETVSRKTLRSPAREGANDAGPTPSLSVRYWKRMRMNQVYPVTVSGSGRGNYDPVTVRLIVGGAQVVPAEHSIDPSNSADRVVFYVTPIARGYLRGERLEVLQDGRKIQEIPLPSRVTSQSGTLVWFFLALFIPWLMLHYFEYSPIGFQAPLNDDGTVRYIAQPWKEYEKQVYEIVGKTDKIKKDRPSKEITDFVENNTFDLKGFGITDKDFLEIYGNIQHFPEDAYLHLFESYHTYNEFLNVRLPLIFFVVLMFITLISYVARTQARKTKYGRPLP
jgi:hypothetical protein